MFIQSPNLVPTDSLFKGVYRRGESLERISVRRCEEFIKEALNPN